MKQLTWLKVMTTIKNIKQQVCRPSLVFLGPQTQVEFTNDVWVKMQNLNCVLSAYTRTRLLQGTLIKIKSNVKLNSDLTRSSFRTAGVSISEADKVKPDSAPNELQHLWKERAAFSLWLQSVTFRLSPAGSRKSASGCDSVKKKILLLLSR